MKSNDRSRGAEGPTASQATSGAGPSLRIAALLLGAVVAIVAAVYWRSLPFPFAFDDDRNIVHNPSLRIHSLEPAEILGATGEAYRVGANRPVAFYTFALNYYFGGLDPRGYRLVNILIHALNALLAFSLTRRLLAARRTPGEEPAAAWGALAAAALWALHPVQTNAVVYVVQRMASLATLFYLGAFLAYLEARQRRRPAWFLAAAGLWALACGTKEIAYVFPFAVLLWEVAFCAALRAWLRRNRWAVPAAAAAGAALFVLAYARYRGGYAPYPFDCGQRLLTEARVVARYWSLLALPHPSRLVLDYRFPISTGLLSPPSTLAALLLHAGVLGAGVWALVRRPVYGFALLGFYLHLAIESTVVPLDLIFEHRLYLPSVFAFAGIGALIAEPRLGASLAGRGRPVALGLACAGVALGSLWTAQRLDVWRDPVSLWSDTLEKQPDNARALSNLGQAYGNLGRARGSRQELELARRAFRRAFELDPRSPVALGNLGMAEAELGNYEEALRALTQAAALGYRDPVSTFSLGLVQIQLGRFAAAAQSFRETLARDPTFRNANFLLGSACAQLGDRESAARHLRRELELYPQAADARRLLNRLEAREELSGRGARP